MAKYKSSKNSKIAAPISLPKTKVSEEVPVAGKITATTKETIEVKANGKQEIDLNILSDIKDPTKGILRSKLTKKDPRSDYTGESSATSTGHGSSGVGVNVDSEDGGVGDMGGYDGGDGKPPTEMGVGYTGNKYITRNETGAIEVSPSVEKMFHTTTSCPCTTYAILDSNREVGCQREYYGETQYFKPAIRINHFIENETPTIGDKWVCEDKTCERSGYSFNGFVVVHVEENKSAPSSSLVNSSVFTENCHVPKALYFSNYTQQVPKETVDYLNDHKLLTVNKIPIFENEIAVKAYMQYYSPNVGAEAGYSNYNLGGIKGYSPQGLQQKNKLITSLMINSYNVLNKSLKNVGMPAGYLSSSNSSNMLVSASGGLISIKISGANNPTFSLTIKDSTGCSILEKQLKDIEIDKKGHFVLEQKFPSIGSKESEVYDIKILPASDVSLFIGGVIHPNSGSMIKKIYQYKAPTVSIKSDGGTNLGTHSNSGTVATTITRDARSSATTKLTHVTTISRTGDNTGSFYIHKDLNFDNCIVRSDVIKKRLITKNPIKHGALTPSNNIRFTEFTNSEGAVLFQGTLNVGMNVQVKTEVVKTIIKTVALDVIKDHDCVECKDNRLIKTSRIDVGETQGLFVGMQVYHYGLEATIISVDCGKEITLSTENTFIKGDTLTFTHLAKGEVLKVINDNHIVTTGIRLPSNAILMFNDKVEAQISGDVKVDKQGSGVINITTTINEFEFGNKDMSFSLDLDSFLSQKPPAKDIYVEFNKNSTENIINIIDNFGINTSDKSFTITKNPKSGVDTAVSSRSGAGTVAAVRRYVPASNFTGTDSMKYTITDGVNTSDEKTIFITVK